VTAGAAFARPAHLFRPISFDSLRGCSRSASSRPDPVSGGGSKMTRCSWAPSASR